MKHMDFSKVTIIPGCADGIILVRRLDRIDFDYPQPCEACGGTSEYELQSNWDEHGQCRVTECQDCMRESVTGPDAPDRVMLNEVVEHLRKQGVYMP